MKAIVFVRVYGLAIMLLLLTLLNLGLNLTSFKIFTNAVLVVCAFMVALLTDKRYIEYFNVHQDRVIITYINEFLQLKTVEYNLSEFKEAKLQKWNALSFLFPPYLRVKVMDKPMDFQVMTKDLHDSIDQSLITNYSHER